jgi:hypothetical protein
MSKFIPDPQIQSLQAMRRGDIAMPANPTKAVGVVPVAQAQPIVTQAVAPVAAPGQGPLAGIFNENPVTSNTFVTTLSDDAAISVNPSAALTTPAITSMPAETPVVGVAKATSVI